MESRAFEGCDETVLRREPRRYWATLGRLAPLAGLRASKSLGLRQRGRAREPLGSQAPQPMGAWNFVAWGALRPPGPWGSVGGWPLAGHLGMAKHGRSHLARCFRIGLRGAA